MVSEVVMYQSMFILGILMFGFLSVTFTDYSDIADETTLQSNLQQVTDEIGTEIVNLINRGRGMQSNLADDTFTITLDLQLSAEFSETPYEISTGVYTNGIAYVYAIANNKNYSNFTLGVLDGTGSGEVNFSGSIYSSSANSQITYFWDFNTLSEQIILS